MTNDTMTRHHHHHDHDHDHDHDHHHHHPHGSQPSGPRQQWRSLEEMAMEERFEELLQRDYPKQAAALEQSGLDRRTFLKLMGASLALTGLTGCATRPPSEPIIPYVRTPEEVIPGRPIYFASAMSLGGVATGVLIETHEGRPTRIDGNPRHPASLGASDVTMQASILELYNPDRSVDVRNNNNLTTWEAFRSALDETLAGLPADGAGLAVLTERVNSPTLARQLEALLEARPGATWYQYEPVNDEAILAGTSIAFGEPLTPVYRMASADLIVSLDADFLTGMPGSLRYAREFADRRRVRMIGGQTSMNRLYAVESTPTSVGAMADHRLPLAPSQIELFARALAQALGVNTGAAAVGLWDATFFNTLVADLQEHRGNSLVIAGRGQPPAVQALAHAINATLGNVGRTVVYMQPFPAAPTNPAGLPGLVQAMNGGTIRALVILGGNPAYTAPADIGFATALSQVPFTVHLSPYHDETSARSTWHVPQTHYIEEWSDAVAYDGTVSVVQPPIGPLYPEVRSAIEIMALLLQDERSSYEIVRETWQASYAGDNFESYWTQALHNGVIGSAATFVEVTLRPDLSAALPPVTTTAAGMEVVFQPDANLFDGRFAGNSWLLELPNPISKLSWDNAVLVSPNTALQLGVQNESEVEIIYAGRTLRGPVWIQPGQADNVVTLNLGYGREQGASVGQGVGFNAYAIRTATAPWYGSGAQVRATGGTLQLATTQRRYDAELNYPVRVATLAKFMENPNFVEDKVHRQEITLLADFPYEDYKWGMAIDLNACVGCNACVIACQTENNIPTVGKDQVRLGREMYWIRLDRYYEGSLENPQTHFQPVPCMHCETAPCELVCPVQATVHSSEGLNQMVYNRCVGTRYCSANCPYGVRRFNFMDYIDTTPILQEVRNPDVSVRAQGIMEKCSFCVQRISAARIAAKKEGRKIQDGEVQPACAVACPTQAIVFGDMNDRNSWVNALKAQPQNYALMGDIQTKPRTTYLARLTNPHEALDESKS